MLLISLYGMNFRVPDIPGLSATFAALSENSQTAFECHRLAMTAQLSSPVKENEGLNQYLSYGNDDDGKYTVDSAY